MIKLTKNESIRASYDEACRADADSQKQWTQFYESIFWKYWAFIYEFIIYICKAFILILVWISIYKWFDYKPSQKFIYIIQYQNEYTCKIPNTWITWEWLE